MEQVAPRLCKHLNDAVAMSVPALLSRLNGGNTLFLSANRTIKASTYTLSLLLLHNWHYFVGVSYAITLLYVIFGWFCFFSLGFSSKFSRAFIPEGTAEPTDDQPAVRLSNTGQIALLLPTPVFSNVHLS